MAEIENDYANCRQELAGRLREAAPGPHPDPTGPRQVGKTTLLLELAEQFGDRPSMPRRRSERALPGFWERCWAETEARAKRGTALLLLDEVHQVPDWAAKLKGNWDRIRRRHIPIHVIATGSSTLRVASGSRESLAGRFERLTLSHWSAASLASAFIGPLSGCGVGLVRFGSYPGAVELEKTPARWRAYLPRCNYRAGNRRDMLALGTVRKPALLRQVFAVAAGRLRRLFLSRRCRTASGQRRSGDGGSLSGPSTGCLPDWHHSKSMRPKLTDAARPPPKLVTLNNGLLSAMHPDGAPDREHEPARSVKG